MSSPPISFGDNVRICTTELTNRMGLAEATGSVTGETVPSSTGVEVIGELENDYAINVMLDRDGTQHWIAPQLVEFVDHAAGTNMEIAGRRFIRDADGEWIPDAVKPSTTNAGIVRRLIQRVFGAD